MLGSRDMQGISGMGADVPPGALQGSCSWFVPELCSLGPFGESLFFQREGLV